MHLLVAIFLVVIVLLIPLHYWLRGGRQQPEYAEPDEPGIRQPQNLAAGDDQPYTTGQPG